MAKRKKDQSTSTESGHLKYLAGILKEVGLPGFIVIVCVSVFLIWGTVEQKREFIDIFILQKHANQNVFPCVLVIISLLFLLIVGSIYSNKILKLRKEENNRIGKEKSELQELLLGKKLKSSE